MAASKPGSKPRATPKPGSRSKPKGSGTRAKPKTAARSSGRKPPTNRRKRGGGGGGNGRGPRNPVLRFFWNLLRWPLILLWRISWRLGAVSAAIILICAGYIAATLPPVDDLVDGRARGSVTMQDVNGQTFAWRGDQFAGMITSEQASENLRNAIVATEDRRYYGHFGVSPRGIASAIRINLSEGRGPLSGHGGSTITQQTAKLLCLGEPYDPTQWKNESAYEADCRETTLWRKAKEAVYAMGMEMRYSKAEILTIYMNRVYLGEGARGFEAASQRYFGKSARDVTPAEAAMLAGLLKAPTRYAPTNNLARSQDRANVIVGLMEREDYLTAAQADNARAHPAQLSEAAQDKSGGYFADWLMSSAPDFLTRQNADVVFDTTLDPRIQKAAEEALAHVFDTKVREGSDAQAAIVVMSADGAVRGMVGGRDLEGGGVFNRATQALRQTGSSFKPFVYATALELGWSWNDVVQDTPLTLNIPGSGPWTPENYDHKFRGPVTLVEALEHSLNIPAVRVAEAAGLDNVRQVAEGFGIWHDLAPGPALALGASEATLVEMVGAYAGILNGGSSVEPYGMTRVTLQGDNEPLATTESGIGERVIREDAARELIYMMRQVVTNGTGRRAGLDNVEIAGKTGTTQAARDAWFIGFSADYVTGVWMGYDNNTPLTGVTGSGLPAEIFHETMVRVQDGLEPRPLPMIHPQPAQGRDMAGDSNGGGGTRSNPVEQVGNVIERALRDIFGLN
ncbi:transglycosylase domain-containing protein [Pseudooceanicola sp. HF7]|uniref:transglycosylase domain-containing protein n=1 Tax=Pseudooceanicola sp. HF7 TaxID=2721560 RepID=UPI00142F46D5|nr:PBP1A family penicillin-binding protein [Pseudooceanicola sp. HF7]NIZ11468.1 PBP1A family penicillin-binding protein [Pseudooceanicola sp. HF7]